MKRDALDFSSLDDVRTWLDGVEAASLDVIAIAEDQTRPLAQREIGRVEAIRIVTEAGSALEATIAFARRGLPAKP
jgi:hypothetical protein